VTELILVIRATLAAIFTVAGVAKLLDRAGSRQSMREFGLPSGLAGPFSLVLPLAELGCAIALLSGAVAWHGAAAAAALLAIFILGMAVNLARGRTPDCHCFGKLHSEPVGWSTVARNIVLVGLALFVVAQGAANTGPGLFEWIGNLTRLGTVVLVLTIGFLLLGGLVITSLVQLLAQNGRLMLRVEALEAKLGGVVEPSAPVPGLPVDSPAPDFSLSGLDGIPVSRRALGALGKPLLLLFSEPGCSSCDAILPDVARWQRDHADRLMIVPISRGSVEANRQKAAEHGLQHLLLQANREVSEAYQVQGTPSAVLVKGGSIASPLAAGAEEIRNLVFRHTLPPPVKQGDKAPALELSDLDGRPMNTAGRHRVLLFWNPTCGFCKAMLKDLRSWERTKPRTAPELVVITGGSAEANREQGFKSRVLLDPVFGAGQVFGATGTPSAVLIDEQGRVASELGVGAPAVLSLLGVRQDNSVTA
jgi:thioredoxin-related protein/uncharacterized membrane protein YphA (DoxX/SURF4 family)